MCIRFTFLINIIKKIVELTVLVTVKNVQFGKYKF